MADEGVRFQFEADTRPLESALKRIVATTDSLVNKLDKGFGLLDVRIGVLRKNLTALDVQARKTGGLLSESIETIGSALGISLVEMLGEALGNSSAESVRIGTNFDRLFKMEPRALLSEFKGLEAQLGAIESATGAGIPATGIVDDISVLKAEQGQVLDALIGQASAIANQLKNLQGFDSTIPDTPQAQNLVNRFEGIRDLLEQIKSISSDRGIRFLLNSLPDLEGFRGHQRGTLEEPASSEARTRSVLTDAGAATIAVEMQTLREVQETLSSTVVRGSQALNEQTNAVGRLDTATRDLGFTFASAFEDAVVEGRRLSDVLEGLERDILRILTRKLVTEPLAGALTGAIGAGFAAFAGEFHGGGKVGSTAVSGRVVPAALFDGAPRFAGGGLVGRVPRLAPGEVPAILHRGEVVRTPAQEAALRGNAGGEGATHIVVNIQTPDPRAFNESRGQIQAMLSDAVRAGRRFR